jgi:hypothetical protein
MTASRPGDQPAPQTYPPLTRRIMRQIDKVAAEDPLLMHTLHEQVQNTSGRLRPLLRAVALLLRHRPRRWSERIARAMIGFAALIAGGPKAHRIAEWEPYLGVLKHASSPALRMLLYGASMALASVQLAWQERLDPRLRYAFPALCDFSGWFLDNAARSAVSAVGMLAVPAAASVGGIGLLIGHALHGRIGEAIAAGALAMACAIVPGVISWQRGRLLAIQVKLQTIQYRRALEE